MAGGYLPFGFAPSGELTSYTPTLRERATDWLRTKLFSDDRAGQEKARRVMDVAEIPFGFALDTYDAGREAGMGNYGTAGVMLGMAGLPGPSPKKIRAFHGSPHDFDRFSLDKIGTGEGAQAYGHGLYFAENEDIARGYRDALKPGKGVGPEDTASRVLDMHGGDRDAAMASLRESIDRANAQNMPYEEVQRLMMAKNILNTQPQRASGRMYEVEIDADPEQFLDWDKPLSEQPEALRNAFNSVDKRINSRGDVYTPGTYEDAGDWVKHFQNAVGAGEAQGRMRAAGIPGIKYLDAGSRVPSAMAKKELADWQAQLSVAERELADATARGDNWLISRKQAEVKRVQDGIARVAKEAEGTRNYVVFDDRLINIVRKYGIAGASAMLGYNILDGMDEAQAAELKSIEGK